MRELENRVTVIERNQAVEGVHRMNVEKRLGGIEDNLKWLIRLIIGGVAMAILGFALNGFTL